ncbi:prenyltransferase/squalene oxidase repeat-containing protein [Anatilimnocola floriformis]|uniref:prenyltransferase/squalene oxidase repeat-containing protein n=1 Tax=Anatilimnocola floriformis TaxID=2948575 RepID=UPI0020C1EBE7|nr:prenyltransferase/squalene oxidase repeat-containing protein [Anatilimnocola floriformis]
MGNESEPAREVSRRAFNTTMSAAMVGAACSPPADLYSAEADRAVTSGLARLVSRQNEDGSFGTSSTRGNVGVCALAGLAFLAAGSSPSRGTYRRNIDKCLEYIIAQGAASGLIDGPDHAMHGTMFKHGFATLFLAECYGMTSRKQLRETLTKAVHLIVSTQNPAEGGWRYEPRNDDGADMTVTTCQAVALRAAKNAGIFVPKNSVDAAADYIKRGQNADGGFMYMIIGSDSAEDPRASKFPRSAAAMTALYALGIHEGPEIAKGLDYLAAFLPPATVKAYYYYGHFHAALALWQAGGDRFDRWYSAMRDDLIARQLADGSWPSTGEGEDCATAMACIALQVPNDCLPIQQR